MSYQCMLDILPVEISYILFSYFSTREILCTFLNVSDYLNNVLINYVTSWIDFRSIRRNHFDLICQYIQPDKVISLTLSDDGDTPDLSKLFFSRFQLQQFFLPYLIRLKLDEAFGLTKLPFTKLRYLKINECSIHELQAIIHNSPNLQSLNVCLHLTNENDFNINFASSKLTRLHLTIENYSVTMNQLEEFISKFSCLKHLTLILSGNEDLIDGYRWKSLTNSSSNTISRKQLTNIIDGFLYLSNVSLDSCGDASYFISAIENSRKLKRREFIYQRKPSISTDSLSYVSHVWIAPAIQQSALTVQWPSNLEHFKRFIESIHDAQIGNTYGEDSRLHERPVGDHHTIYMNLLSVEYDEKLSFLLCKYF
ncbi:hypothetical protein I4U23_022104 [Adineta vaga]|nr:hypothetical protein I4U23_022104 [Adineta vaga]